MNTRETDPELYFHILYLRALKRPIAEIAEKTGYSRRHVLRILAEARDEHENRKELATA